MNLVHQPCIFEFRPAIHKHRDFRFKICFVTCLELQKGQVITETLPCATKRSHRLSKNYISFPAS